MWYECASQLTLVQFRRASSQGSSDFESTIPGESSRLILLSILKIWHSRVKPGTQLLGAAFLRISVLMTALFPVFGIPTKPTVSFPALWRHMLPSKAIKPSVPRPLRTHNTENEFIPFHREIWLFGYFPLDIDQFWWFLLKICLKWHHRIPLPKICEPLLHDIRGNKILKK